MAIVMERDLYWNSCISCCSSASGYLEIEHFKNTDLHTGYFCYNCAYFIKPNHCAIVEDNGPDVYNKGS